MTHNQALVLNLDVRTQKNNLKLVQENYSSFSKKQILKRAYRSPRDRNLIINRADLSLIHFIYSTQTPQVGFEPTTNRLTVDRSTAELLRIACTTMYHNKRPVSLATP